MYYRRKILLALIEVFDGSLPNTDCEKLLFNFCQQTGKNHYDFFPYKYGPFSFLSYYDKRRMIDLGLLKTADDFQLSTTLRRSSHRPDVLAGGQAHSYLNELTPADKTALLKFKSQIGDLRGDKLVKKIYREFPQYTSRHLHRTAFGAVQVNKIAGRHFTADEINQLQFAWNTDTKPAVFSIGYEGLTIDSFLNKLIATH